jgi:hypothetical protein
MGRVKQALIFRNNVPSLIMKQTNIQTRTKPSVFAIIVKQDSQYGIMKSYIQLMQEQRKNSDIRASNCSINTSFLRSKSKPNISKYNQVKSEINNNNENRPNKSDHDIDTEYLTRKANLGTMVQMLQIKVPNMLTKTIPREFVSKNIILKILPNQFPNLPEFKGYTVCSSTLKTIQKLVILFYLNPNAKIHITNIKIIEPTNSMSSDELINLSIDENRLENSTLEECEMPKQDTSKYTTKIKIKWRTCYSGCEHLQDKQTTDAKWGSYSLDYFNWTKFLKSTESLQKEAKKTFEELAKTLDPLTNNEKSGNVGRVLNGVFIFELDAKNEKIAVFTIDNMEILESKEINYTDGVFAA